MPRTRKDDAGARLDGAQGSSEIRVAIVSGQRILAESLALVLDDCTDIAVDAVGSSFDDADIRSRPAGIIIAAKLDTSSRTQAVIHAIRRGIV
jgi:hypothetical protein